MTPFGSKVRALRAARGVLQKTMARDLGVSNAYLSALEHGHRGQPTPDMVIRICRYFGLFGDEAAQLQTLARLSSPRLTVDTSGLSARATYLVNILSEHINELDEQTIEWIIAEIEGVLGAKRRRADYLDIS